MRFWTAISYDYTREPAADNAVRRGAAATANGLQAGWRTGEMLTARFDAVADFGQQFPAARRIAALLAV
jgi:hypothetical protein